MIKTFLFACIFSLISCNSLNAIEIKGRENIQDDALMLAISNYYKYEANKNWDKTYELRTNGFKSTVPFSLYKRKMSVNSVGWIFQSLNITDVIYEQNSNVDIYIEFYSILNGQHRKYTQRTNWIKSKDKIWEANIPGKRGVFIMNDWVKQ
jgi:hypothetical protein